MNQDEAQWLPLPVWPCHYHHHFRLNTCVRVFRGPSVKRTSGMERSQSSTWDGSEENRNKLVKAASTSKLLAKVVKNAERYKCTPCIHTLTPLWTSQQGMILPETHMFSCCTFLVFPMQPLNLIIIKHMLLLDQTHKPLPWQHLWFIDILLFEWEWNSCTKLPMLCLFLDTKTLSWVKVTSPQHSIHPHCHCHLHDV